MNPSSVTAEAGLDRLVDTVYGAALAPARWSEVLAQLAQLFHASFADIVTRSLDGDHANGLAHGLDAGDDGAEFPGFWLKRNAWRDADPVMAAGEVTSTRAIVDVTALRRSETYDDDLHQRGLHEGMRLSLWIDHAERQVVSVLRPRSRGPFGPEEIALGRRILPHLQRAAAVNRRLRDVEFDLEVARGGGGGSDVAALALDPSGRPCWANETAEAVLAEGGLLRSRGGDLLAATPTLTAQLKSAIARAVGRAGPLRQGGAVALRTVGGTASVRNLVVVPFSHPGDWTVSRPPAALAFLRHPLGANPCQHHLSEIFDLTKAEADLAARLMRGAPLRNIAFESGRSINTVRTHLARLMAKTGTDRQVDLVRLLGDVADQRTGFDAAGLAAAPAPRRGLALFPVPRRAPSPSLRPQAH